MVNSHTNTFILRNALKGFLGFQSRVYDRDLDLDLLSARFGAGDLLRLLESLLFLAGLLLLLLLTGLLLLGLLERDLPNLPPFPPLLISTLQRLPHSLVPSSSLTASWASLRSSISTKAKPGGFRATQTSRTRPIRLNASSMSNLLASSGRPPM